jgi:hypothetical protein
MPQTNCLRWITPAGSLGVIPEGVFYSVPVEVDSGDEDVYFQLIAGQLPDGVQITANGMIEGTPKNTITVQGVPLEVSEDVTSKFAIRAYTVRIVDGIIVVDRLADRTFSITVSGQDAPEFITPAGNIGTFYDGTEISIPIEYTDTDPDEELTVRLVSGELPPGVFVNPKTGTISGVIFPLVGPPGTAPAGYDATEYDEYPYDFFTRSTNKNYQFTLEVTDGKESDVRTFEIFVYSKSTMVADTTDITADDTFVTADVTPDRPPVLLTPEGDLGVVRADNWYAFKFDGIDFDGEPIEYVVTTGAGQGYDDTPYDMDGFDRGAFSLPPGLQIDPNTGWFYGYIPDQGVTEQTYKFAVRVKTKIELGPVWNISLIYPENSLVSFGDTNYVALQLIPAGTLLTNTAYWQPQYIPISRYYYFTITITGQVDTDIEWITPANLGSVFNGDISTLYVEAINTGGRALQYRIDSGSDSKLPQGLTLQPSGHITGKVSFNTFALDGGTTIFDKNSRMRSVTRETTFDLEFDFTVNAFSSEAQQLGYRVGSIVVANGGSGYSSSNPPTVTISAPPETADSIQATAGVVTIVNGAITNIALGNPGRGYLSTPTVTITGGGGVGATATATIIEANISNAVSVFRRFKISVIRRFNEPYQKLYIKCMPPEDDRALIDQLIQNQDIIPVDFVYRPDDSNFGVAKNVVYDHAYGLNAVEFDRYVESLDINHYWKYITLGRIKTAQALDAQGNILYEVVYSQVIDDLVNDQGQSVSKEITWPYPIDVGGETITQVYPNSLINMRDQVVDTVGEIPPPLIPALPRWMTSKQKDGRVLGFTPAWVIAYVKPGRGAQVLYNIQNQFGNKLNLIDYKIDRYEIDRGQTHSWDPEIEKWIPQPPAETTFDANTETPSIVGWINESSVAVNWENEDDQAVFWLNPGDGIPQRGTIFDGRATRFITPADRWTGTDEFDKYLLFPRVNILG